MSKINELINKTSIMTVSAVAFWSLLLKPQIWSLATNVLLMAASVLWLICTRIDKIRFENTSPFAKVAVVIPMLFGVGFYERWAPSSKIDYLAQKVGLSNNTVVLLGTIVGILFALPFSTVLLSCVCGKIKKVVYGGSETDSTTVKNIFKDMVSLKKGFLILCGVLFVAMIPIIRANVNYTDDIGRVQSGYANWQNYCRYFSSFLAKFLHVDTYLNDVSPFPQILAIAAMAASGVIVLYLFTGKTRFSVWEYAAIFPLCLSPHFLGCLLFKYDAPYMAFSVLFSVLPFVFRKAKLSIYGAISFVSLLLMCMSYQASSGIYVVVVIFLAFKEWNEKTSPNKDILKYIVVSATSFLSAMLVFRVIYNVFAYSLRSTEMFSLKELPLGVINNISVYIGTLMRDSKPLWLLLTGLVLIGYLVSVLKASKQKKWLSALFSIVMLLLAIIFSYGAYLFLKEGADLPRYIYGIYSCIAISAVCAVSQNINFAKTSSLLLSASFIVFSFACGNMLTEQAKYEEYILNMVTEDLQELELVQNDAPMYIACDGAPVYSAPLKNSPSPLLKKLVWGDFMAYRLAFYYNFDLINDPTVDFSELEFTPIHESHYYTISVYDNYILVTFK